LIVTRAEDGGMTNPVLVELTRGKLVESVHTGAFAISRPNGESVLALGDTGRPVFPRSAIKAFQCLAVIESGAADRYGFGDAEIALACSSHSGTPRHAELAGAILARAGLDTGALGCGAHDPIHEASARALFKAGLAPSALHNNCSGKHAAMLATCVHCGDPVAGYLNPSHAHQRRIARVLQEVCGAPIDDGVVGVDGCSAPNWAMPLSALAKGFARFITGDGLPRDRCAAAGRIARACAAEPTLVAGPGRLDTTAMTALGPRIFMKTGAEGVYCGALVELGLGFAIKFDDGNKRASEAVVEASLRCVFGDEARFGALGPIRNWVGTEVGETRVTEVVMRGLDGAELQRVRVT
jgi:L-asparaginase II